MRIYKMTATFGKLEHETLTLEPGLNIITAPNEWGKSTWCAFLIAMLYGLDTRAKSTKTALADKERYQPWSGSPMSGRIDINWNGRDITIERTTRRRVPLGEFKAYETISGLPVEELTDDLYHSGRTDDIMSIRTYYEQQWLDRGMNIKYLRFRLPQEGELREPDVEIELDNYRSYNRSKRSGLTTSH